MTRLFIGGLADDISKGMLEEEFDSFGHIEDIFVAANPPGFGFIVYEKSREAEAAIKEMNGRNLRGAKIRVEYARERGSRGGGRGEYRGGGRGGGGRDASNIQCYNCLGYGHMSRECTKPRSSYGGGGGRGPGGGGAGGGRRRSRSRSAERDRKQSRRSRSRSRDRYSRR